jgi:hypothetical protein
MFSSTHYRRYGIVRVAAVLGVTAVTLAVSAAGAGAAPGATFSASAAGLQVQCVVAGAPTTFTATDGTIHEVNQMHQDSNGVYSFTGTISLQNVTANDGTTDTVYQIVGASWFGGSGTSQATATVRGTDDLNIIGPQGKVADVHASLTFYPDGTVKGVSFGDCAPPV